MYFIGKLKLDVSTQDNINAAFFKYSTCFTYSSIAHLLLAATSQ